MKIKTIRKIIESKEARILGLFYLLGGIFAINIISKFPRIYDEMYGKNPIPAFPQFLMNSNPYLWGICVCIPGVILILSDRKELNMSIIKACLFVFLMILGAVTVVGLFLPLSRGIIVRAN